jgi:hypothetical protein
MNWYKIAQLPPDWYEEGVYHTFMAIISSFPQSENPKDASTMEIFLPLSSGAEEWAAEKLKGFQPMIQVPTRWFYKGVLYTVAFRIRHNRVEGYVLQDETGYIEHIWGNTPAIFVDKATGIIHDLGSDDNENEIEDLEPEPDPSETVPVEDPELVPVGSREW